MSITDLKLILIKFQYFEEIIAILPFLSSTLLQGSNLTIQFYNTILTSYDDHVHGNKEISSLCWKEFG